MKSDKIEKTLVRLPPLGSNPHDRFVEETNEYIRRTKCHDLADTLRAVQDYVDGYEENAPDETADLDLLITWLERISRGEDPSKVILTATPRKNSIRNERIYRWVKFLYGGRPGKRKPAERRVAEMYGTTHQNIRMTFKRTKEKRS